VRRVQASAQDQVAISGEARFSPIESGDGIAFELFLETEKDCDGVAKNLRSGGEA
jgi:hypothetical protein